LETQIGIQLFDRTVRYPKPTAAGALPVADARSVVANVAVRKVRATSIFKGLEPELSAVIDVLYPIEAIAEAALKIREQSPHTPLRLYVKALNGAYQPVIDGRCSRCCGFAADRPGFNERRAFTGGGYDHGSRTQPSPRSS
jgi:hypothetical protein